MSFCLKLNLSDSDCQAILWDLPLSCLSLVVYTYTSLAHLFSALPPPPLLGRGGGSRSLKRQAEDVYVLQGQVKVKVKGQWSMVKVKSQG